LQAYREVEDPCTALEDERIRRERWYSAIIPWMNLYHVLKRSSYGSLLPPSVRGAADVDELTEQNAFVGMIVVEEAEGYTVAQWADIRDVTEDALRSNVNAAREKLLAEEDRDPTGGKE
jgi:hypothetical protein